MMHPEPEPVRDPEAFADYDVGEPPPDPREVHRLVNALCAFTLTETEAEKLAATSPEAAAALRAFRDTTIPPPEATP